MKPLSELGADASASERRLAELFKAADTYQTNPLTKRRVLIQMQAQLQQPKRLRLRPASLALLLVAGSAAAAAIGQRALSSETAELPPFAPLTTPVTEYAPKAAPTQAQQTVTEPADSPAIEATSNADPELASAASPSPKQRVAKRPRTTAKVVAKHTAKQAGEDPTRVAEALRALRKQDDPTRAQALLRDYMKQNPRGALSEEALALTIEAAHARRDPKAKRHARRYLAEYPKGRHRALARRVLRDQ